jgi:tRNA uridine 5-carboxymethylaminomethyl modification enzyme
MALFPHLPAKLQPESGEFRFTTTLVDRLLSLPNGSPVDLESLQERYKNVNMKSPAPLQIPPDNVIYTSMKIRYDVIVIGSGHAGIEAALAAARMGADTLMLTAAIDNIGLMSCNPAIGGLAKGNLVKDIDAIGGEMAKAIDATGIQFRVLNRKKGAAVWSSRAQADKAKYRDYMINTTLSLSGLKVFQAIVNDIYVENGVVTGVSTSIGVNFYAPQIILAAGTFLRGQISVGMNSYKGGRMNEPSAGGISEKLISLGFAIKKFRTDTTARLHIDSINIDGLARVTGDNPIKPFSFETESVPLPQQDCYVTFTNEETHKIIRNGMTGKLKVHSLGPRYCPAIEDKVLRFAERDRHQVILEPEGLNSREVYVNGMTTSLPYDVFSPLSFSMFVVC